MTKYLLRCFLSLALVMPGFSPAFAAPQSFPFDGNVETLTPEEIQIQRYKLQRLRIKLDHGRWYIVRGINDNIDDFNLLKMVGKAEKIKEYEQSQLVGNSIALGGLALLITGGLMLSNIVKLDNGNIIGIGLVVVGGGMALTGEMMAGNIGDEYFHIIEMSEAEKYIAEYNEALKKKLGVSHIENLD